MGSGAAGIGAGAIPEVPFGGAADPSMVPLRDGFQVIPSLSVGQRYDSNVFFTSKSRVRDREDFVSTAVPQIRGAYVGDSFAVNAVAGATGEYYAKNTDLNYVGANTGLALSLNKLVDRWWQGATLTVADTYIYSPQAPVFLIGNLNGDNANPYATGFQVGRASVSRNILRTDFSLPLNQVVSMTGSYSTGFVDFGNSNVQQAALLDSKYQTYTAGLSMRASPQDILSVNGVNNEIEYTSQAGGSFTMRGGTVGWEHLFTPSLSSRIHAGATVLQRELGGTPPTSTTAPIGDVGLFWKDRTTTLAVIYTLGVAPSMQFQAQAMRTHVVSFAVTQETPLPDLLAVANVNYGRGDQYGGSSGADVSYVSVMGSGGLVYKLTPHTFLGVNYSYMNIDNNFGGNTVAFDRHVAQLSLTQAFY
jgi:hypothetical protein